MRYFLAILILVAVAVSGSAQRYNIGIRAGLNYSKILGPAEEGIIEGSRFNNGLHFGITFAYKMNEIAGFKTELSYSAVGSRDSIVGDSYYIFGIGTSNTVKEGYVKRYLDRNNSYINIPFFGYVYPFEKLELFAGPYVGFLINPSAGGTIEFDDQSDELKYSFIQSLDYNYYSDEPRQWKGFNQALTVIVDDNTITMPRVAGAYYQFVEKNGGLYRWFDVGISAGFQYYINRSFFAGLRADYGLIDITRQKMDVSYVSLNNDSYILRDDYDRNFSLQLSLGFKF